MPRIYFTVTIALGLIALGVSAGYDPSLAQGIYYNEMTGETVTSDGRTAFIRDIPMPLAPPLLPPNQRRRIIIIKRPELRYIVKHWVDHRQHASRAARVRASSDSSRRTKRDQ